MSVEVISKKETLVKEAVKVEHCPEFSDDEPWMVILQNETQGESFHFKTEEEAELLAESVKKMVRWIIDEVNKSYVE